VGYDIAEVTCDGTAVLVGRMGSGAIEGGTSANEFGCITGWRPTVATTGH
jgi:hypothetical protein